jgi:hypothetical protein
MYAPTQYVRLLTDWRDSGTAGRRGVSKEAPGSRMRGLHCGKRTPAEPPTRAPGYCPVWPRAMQRMLKPPFRFVFRPVVPFIPFEDHRKFSLAPRSVSIYIARQAPDSNLVFSATAAGAVLGCIKKEANKAARHLKYRGRGRFHYTAPLRRVPPSPFVIKFILATPAISKETEGLRRTCWKETAAKAPW